MSNASRTVYGIFSVPSYTYPWVMLLLIQCIIPKISFTAQLAGIVTGTLEVYGVWNTWLIPTKQYLAEMEQWRILRPLVHYPTFCSVLASSTTPATNESGYQDAAAVRFALGQGEGFLRNWMSSNPALSVQEIRARRLARMEQHLGVQPMGTVSALASQNGKPASAVEEEETLGGASQNDPRQKLTQPGQRNEPYK